MSFSFQGNIVGYGNLQYLKKEGIDVLSMIRVDEQQDENRSFSSEALKTPDYQVTFRPKLKRHQSHSPGLIRRMKHTSLHDFDVQDPLLVNGDGDGLSRAQSAYNLQMFSPHLVHDRRVRSFSNVYDAECGDREEVLSEVCLKISLYVLK